MYDYHMAEQASKNKVWTVAIILIILLSIWFLWPQMATLIFAALMAFLFYPLYLKLKKKKSKGHAAAGATLTISFLVVLLPLMFIVLATIGQIAGFVDYLNQSGVWERTPEFAKTIIERANTVMLDLTGNNSSITEAGIISYLRSNLPGAIRTFSDILFGMVANVPQLGIALLIYIFAFIEFTLRGSDLIKKLKKVSPFSKDETDRYIERIGLMANAMVKGQLMISMIIALISSLLLIPLGFGNYFFIFFVLFTILNFIPLGSGIIMVPLTIYAMLTGQFWQGLIVLILYYLAGNLDTILRPKFIPDKIKLSTAWTIIATFCGIAYFGILGVVYGPIIMILITTTWELYINSKNKKITSAKTS